MSIKLHFPLLKRGSIYFTALLMFFNSGKLFPQPAIEDGYHPKKPEIERIPNLEPLRISYDNGTYYLYRNRQFNKLEAVSLIKKTQLLVVVDDEQSDIGKALKHSFSIYWKYTNYKFIPRSEVINYAGKAGYSFFMFVRDEYYQPGSSDRTGINSWIPPHLYYQSDTMQHVPKPGFHLGGDGEYSSTYLFVVCLTNGNPIKDTKEEKITENNLSIADYIVPEPSTMWHPNNYDNKSAGLLLDKEKELIPEFNTIVSNFQDDFEYIHQNKKEYISKEKEGIALLGKCTLLYNGQAVEIKVNNLIYADKGKKAIKGKNLYINSEVADELGRSIIAHLLEMDDNSVKRVSKIAIDSILSQRGSENLVLADTTHDRSGDYKILTTEGIEVIGFTPKCGTGAFGMFDLLGNDAWSERKKITVR